MNPKLFKKRLVAFYCCWRKQRRDLWGNADVLVISTSPSENQSHPISSFFFLWLIGHDFSDTIAIFTRNEIYFLCSNKKFFSLLRNLESPAMDVVNAKVTVHMRSKGDNGLELMDGIMRGIKVRYNAKGDTNETRPLVVGYISGESPKSKLLWSCFNNLEFRSAHVLGFSQMLNHDQDVRYLGESSEERDFELYEECTSNDKVGFGSRQGNCKEIQMHSLPDEFEQMLALTSERKEEAPGKADDKKLQLERGKGNSPDILLHKAEKSLHPKEVEQSSSEYGLVSDPEDEWVLVEDDDEEEYIGKMEANASKKRMALAHYKL